MTGWEIAVKYINNGTIKGFPKIIRKHRRIKLLVSPKSKEACRVTKNQGRRLGALMRKTIDFKYPANLKTYCMIKRLILI